MALKLMYITNNPDVARIAEEAGVDRIFVDMEYIGKADRQGGMDTVQSRHTAEDVRRLRPVVKNAQLMVRINPIHSGTAEYNSSREEIEAVIEAGADVIMLPYFKTAEEVKRFVEIVGGRAKTFPLVETPEAVAAIDEILAVPGIDEIHVGLNDLSLGLGRKFMFELLSDGTIDALAEKFKAAGISFGFGGIASLGRGILPSEYVVREHYRLGSTATILSRSFCNVHKIQDLRLIRRIFRDGVAQIRDLEAECAEYAADSDYFAENARIVAQKVRRICDGLVEVR